MREEGEGMRKGRNRREGEDVMRRGREEIKRRNETGEREMREGRRMR